MVGKRERRKAGKIKVLFVCTGNICRSPMAEAIMASKVREAGLEDRVVVDSAGTISYHEGEQADPRTLAVLEKHGVEFPSLARQIKHADLEKFDLIVAMDNSHMRVLEHMAADLKKKPKLVRCMDFAPGLGEQEVPDPYYEGGFERVYEMIDAATDGLLEWLKSNC